MSDDDEGIVGIFMYEWQLDHIQNALAYYASNAYLRDGVLEEIDDLMVQLEEGKMVQEEGEMVAYYVAEDDGNVH